MSMLLFLQHYYFCLHLGTLWVSWYSSNSTKLCVRRQEKADPYISVTSTSLRQLEKNWGWRISFSASQSNVLYINSLFKWKSIYTTSNYENCQYHDKQSLELFIHSSDYHTTCIRHDNCCTSILPLYKLIYWVVFFIISN